MTTENIIIAELEMQIESLECQIDYLKSNNKKLSAELEFLLSYFPRSDKEETEK